MIWKVFSVNLLSTVSGAHRLLTVSSAICQNILNPGYKETEVSIGRLQAGVGERGGGGILLLFVEG